jgi:GH15 family glucan-1,4-alpha-glucosidase
VAGLRALGKATTAGRRAPEWLALADRLLAEAASDGVHHGGRWQRAPEDQRVDAALVLPGLRGATPPDDPRHTLTLAAVLDELTEDGYVYRFRHDARPLHDAEGAFLLCGFWIAEALAQQGKPTDAMRWFERTRAACGPSGLFTEEFDVGQRQLRGNLPQAFVHAELLHAAGLLSRDPEALGPVRPFPAGA